MNWRRVLLVASLLAALLQYFAHAESKTALVLGTATPGGEFPLCGAVFADTVEHQGGPSRYSALLARNIDHGPFPPKNVNWRAFDCLCTIG